MSIVDTPQSPPWYESNLLWGPVALGAGILLAVVATMKADLRWLLWLALPCFLLACWIVVRQINQPTTRRIVAAICFFCICAGLYRMNVWLRPPSSVAAQSQSDKATEVRPEEKKQDNKSQDTKKPEAKPKPKDHAPSQDIKVGPVEQGPCSNLQIGGSGNQQTVNCGSPLPPPRHLSEDDSTAMRKVLQTHSGVHYRIVATGEEAIQFANELRSVFDSAGWVPEGNLDASSGSSTMPQPALSLISDKETGNASLVRAAFKAAHLELPLDPYGFTGPLSIGRPEIVIGVCPQKPVKN